MIRLDKNPLMKNSASSKEYGADSMHLILAIFAFETANIAYCTQDTSIKHDINTNSIKNESANQAYLEAKLAWESIESIQFHGRTEEINDQEKLDKSSYIEHDCVLASQGRTVQKLKIVTENKIIFYGETRTDGEKVYVIDYLENNSKIPSNITITYLPDKEAVLKSRMNEVLWMVVPGGKPIFRHIENATDKLLSNDKRYLEITANITEKQRYQCKLDKNHDWLPIQAKLLVNNKKGISYTFFVNSFAVSNGHWFPTKVTQVTTSGNKRVTKILEVTEFKINAKLDSSIFTLPKNLEKGVLISDKTRSRGSRILGGSIARDKFLAKYSGGETNKGETNKIGAGGQRLLTSRDPSIFPWSTLLSIASTALLVAGIGIWIATRIVPKIKDLYNYIFASF